MAAKKNEVAVRSGRTDLANLDAQLAQEAANEIAKAIARPSGRKITVKNKQFILPDGTNLGEVIDVIVVDFITANRYYPDQFSPNDLKPPVCFAFGKEIATMAPMEESPEKQSDDGCTRCPMNQWESDPKGGKGKACKNTRDLAVILASDAGDPDAPMFTVSVSPTGIKSFDAMVAYIARTLSGPPVKAIISIACNPNTEYASMIFSDAVPNPDYADHYGRREEASELLYVLPDLSNYVPTDAKPARGRPAAAPSRAARAPTRR
jgi:hypothetical protein